MKSRPAFFTFFTSFKFSILISCKASITLAFIIYLIFNNIESHAQFKSSILYKADTLGYLSVNGYVEQNNKPLENASIIVYEDNRRVANVRTPEDGKFNLKLTFNKYYKIEITKLNHVVKKFEFNTNLPAYIDNHNTFTFSFNIDLFPKYNYIDMSILEKPLAIITYQKKYEDYFYEYNYAKSINDKVMYIEKRIEELTQEYRANVDEGRKLFEKQEYKSSLVKFKRANEIFPDEAYPIERIAAINKILNEKKKLKGNYDNLLADAEENVKVQKYESAIDLLGKALQILPEEKYPAQRIKEIKKLMSDLALRENSYKLALLNADSAFKKNNYQEAGKYYTEATQLFPERSYPETRIEEINKIYSKLNNEELYNKSIKEGDLFLSDSKLTDAKNAYNKALSYKPTSQYPKEKINYIDKLLTEISRKDADYINIISEADKLFSETEYPKAKTEYLKASNLKPDKKYPKDKVEEINKLTEEAKSKEELYSKTIANADEKFNNKEYQNALEQYKLAITYKAGNEYPLKQITKINDILAEEAQQQTNYNNLISLADNLLEEKKYNKAKTSFQEALRIKPNEQYPKDKISEINNINKEEENKLSEYWKIIEEADLSLDMLDFKKAKDLYLAASRINPNEAYPVAKFVKLTDILEEKLSLDETFNKLMLTAELAMTSKFYTKARDMYMKALEIKPEDKTAKEQIAKLDLIMKSKEANREEYNNSILKADDLFDLQKYNESRELYNKAHQLNPIQLYPVQRINEINNILHSVEYAKAIGEINKELIERMSEKKFSFNPISEKQENNMIVINAKNLSKKPYKMLVFYGKNNTRSGGFELDVNENDSVEKYVVRVGKQDKWVNQDNNWISLQPLGGNIEVNNIQILKGE